MSESQRVMLYQIILEDPGTTFQHISRFDKIVVDNLSRFPSTSITNYDTSTMKAQCCLNALFAISRVENNEGFSPLNIFIVKREQQKELINYKLGTYLFVSEIRLLQASSLLRCCLCS